MIDVSIIVPGITTKGWMPLYESAVKSRTRVSFEMIFVGPYDLPSELSQLDNVRYIKSFASPVRCIQEAMAEAKGEYVTLGTDDGLYFPDALDKSFDILDAHNREYKTIVTCKYIESPGRSKPKPVRKNMSNIKYWTINTHPLNTTFFSAPDWRLIHVSLMKNDYFKEIGGCDCQFEFHATAMTDLAIRVQNDGAKVYVTDFFVLDLDHLPEVPQNLREGHGPVWDAQVHHDMPLYTQIYNRPDSKNRTVIPFDNWKESPDVWARRTF